MLHTETETISFDCVRNLCYNGGRRKEGVPSMIYNQQNGPKMTEQQIEAYLVRIGHEGPVTLDLAGLSAIHKAHQRTVPFENLDILAGVPLSLDHEALFDKIITRRRGGVCAELNTIYNWLLYSLGFQVTSYNSRIITGENVEFRRHRVLGIRFGDKTYTTDVGSTMEYARMPLLLEEGVVQEDGIIAIRAAAGATVTRRLIERAGIIVDALDITSVDQEKALIRELFGLPTDYGS